jgi:ribonuclease R
VKVCRIRDIKDDYYTFDSEQYARRNKFSKLLQLGDEIYVKVKNADLVKNS